MSLAPRDLQCPNVRAFFGEFPEDIESHAVYDYAAETLEILASSLGQVKILVETHDSMTTAVKIRPLLDRIGSSSIGVLWDMAHSSRAGS